MDINFKKYSKEQLIDYCRTLYKEDGIEALSYERISETGNLYSSLYKHGITLKDVIDILDLRSEYDDYKQNNKKWSSNNIVLQAKEIIEEFGYLPPAEWLRKNGYGSLVTALYQSGSTFADLRNELNANESSSFVQSRNGMRWRSHPEASFSNFLYTRGIEHERGRKYPNDYADFSGLTYGYYDILFLDKHGKQIDVEIWGDKPNGHKEEFYAHKRKIKEDYNKNNPCFIGIEFKDCFDEERLTTLLEPYIGIIEPYIYEKPSDEVIPSVHWSNADELIEYCKEFVKQFPNQEFPTEEWLRKRGKWANRKGEAYNTLSIYIKKWIGGVRKLREILDQSHVSTEVWSKEKALEEYKNWYKQYNMLVGSSRARHKRGQIQLPEAEFKRACRIEDAVLKYVGSAIEAQRILGLQVNQKEAWDKEKALAEYRQWYEKYNISPGSAKYRYSIGQIHLTEEEFKRLNCIEWAVVKYVGGGKEAQRILGLTVEE